MAVYPDESHYRRRLETDARLPLGFQAARTTLNFTPREKTQVKEQSMNLALIRLDQASPSFAGVFTQNAFPGWPVVVGRELLEESLIRGILINSRAANAGVPGGREAAENVTRSLGSIIQDKEPYFPSSTGVIGWQLPQKEMIQALPRLTAGLQGETILPVAEAIMTTDAWPKVRSRPCGEGLITGIAKGAGMIEPRLATMLAFFLTDTALPREAARRILPRVVETTFNRVSVDSSSSTSDAVHLFASGRRPYPGDAVFTRALEEAASALAEDVVRNGEGTAHVLEITVTGAGEGAAGELLARAAAASPLIKTAIRGNDPNPGRILQALGAQAGQSRINLDPQKLRILIGDEIVYTKGGMALDDSKEEKLYRYLVSRELPVPSQGWPPHEKRVEIRIDAGGPGPAFSVMASDLSEEYIKINAEYRT